MDVAAQGRAMELLGRFNDDLTRAFDAVFGTQWAEIEEMLAIAAIVTDPLMTTRQLAETTRLNRRAVSRMVARLQAEGLILTRPSDADRRAVVVGLTDRGRRDADRLRVAITRFFLASSGIAREISDGLGPSDSRVNSDAADAMDLLRRVCEAGVALVRVMPDTAAHGRLAARQRAALVHIAMTGGARPHDLVPALGVSRAGVAYIVDQLAGKGFATRRRGGVPEDRRAVVVEATPAGMAAVAAVMTGIEAQRESLCRLFAEVAQWQAPRPSGRPPSR